jgi:hypothetical protein
MLELSRSFDILDPGIWSNQAHKGPNTVVPKALPSADTLSLGSGIAVHLLGRHSETLRGCPGLGLPFGFQGQNSFGFLAPMDLGLNAGLGASLRPRAASRRLGFLGHEGSGASLLRKEG